MKKRLLSLTAALLLLSGCAAPASEVQPEEEGTLHILATTYPVYLLTTALTQGVEGVEVQQLVNQPISCLHDYTLTVTDMKAIEKADVIVMSGAGLEDFMADALAQSRAAVIDSSQGAELLPTLEHVGHDGHDHEEELDPHIWMSPTYAADMLGAIAVGLEELTGVDYHTAYLAQKDILAEAGKRWAEQTAPLAGKGLITFHDGFQYFAQFTGLDLLKAIEEEEGSTASASEVKEMVSLIESYHIPAIFTEREGSTATAQAIARETGCGVYELNMIMSGTGTGLQPYLDAMDQNVATLVEAFS